MGEYTNAPRRIIHSKFEGTGGDLLPDGTEPMSVESKSTRTDVLTGKVRADGDTLDIRYRIVDASLDDGDARRLILIAYLDVLTAHHWHTKNQAKYPRTNLRFTNEHAGTTVTTPYPDPE